MTSEEKLRRAEATLSYLSSKTWTGPGAIQVMYDYFEAWNILQQHQVEVLDSRIRELEQAVRDLSPSLSDASDDSG
jgi:polyhydroxyalkanoate synthesis regulator phasin